MARSAASGRSTASGRSALAHPQRVLNFANSLRLIGASNQIGSVGAWAASQSPTRTIEFWARHIIAPAGTTPIWSLITANYYFGFGDNVLFQSYSDAGAVQRTASSGLLNVQPGTWNHYSYTVDVSGSDVTVKFYLNGVQSGATFTNSAGMNSSYGGLVVLGAFASASLNYTGFITGLKLYTRALTATEILARYRNVPVTGLSEEWLFADGSGATVTGSAGHNFTMINTPTWEANVVPMKSRSAA